MSLSFVHILMSISHVSCCVKDSTFLVVSSVAKQPIVSVCPRRAPWSTLCLFPFFEPVWSCLWLNLHRFFPTALRPFNPPPPPPSWKQSSWRKLSSWYLCCLFSAPPWLANTGRAGPHLGYLFITSTTQAEQVYAGLSIAENWIKVVVDWPRPSRWPLHGERANQDSLDSPEA